MKGIKKIALIFLIIFVSLIVSNIVHEGYHYIHNKADSICFLGFSNEEKLESVALGWTVIENEIGEGEERYAYLYSLIVGFIFLLVMFSIFFKEIFN